MCKPMLRDTPQPCACICIWMESIFSLGVAVVMKLRETVTDAFTNDQVVGVFIEETPSVDDDILFSVENTWMLVFEFIMPSAEAALRNTDILTDEPIDKLFSILLDPLFGILAVEMTGIFARMDVDAFVHMGVTAWFGAVMTVWKCIMSASFETSFFSSRVSYSC